MSEIDDIVWDFGPNSAEENLDPVPYTVKCRYCGMDGLEWGEIASGKWRLYEGNSLHRCKALIPGGNP